MARHEVNNKISTLKLIKTKEFLNVKTLLYINIVFTLINTILQLLHLLKG